MGRVYREGVGVPKNEDEALKWYLSAAKQGYGLAQGAVGASYALGLGAPVDLVQAYMWFALAEASVENEELRFKVAETLKAVAEKMTPDQIGEAEKLASEWKVAH